MRKITRETLNSHSYNQCDNPNELLHEKSPYLRMHSCDPIKWRPWNERSLKEAREKQKPIFLSIGYSSCHWCHVMHKESFKDPDVARILNEYFIPIKVDREEKPDIDDLYMTSIIMITGSGGWPLNVFLTPDLKPFYGGTYFSKDNFIEILKKIVELWDSERDKLYRAANEIFKALEDYFKPEYKGDPETIIASNKLISLMDKTYTHLGSQFDPEFGGFGSSMKFPMIPSNLFLLRYWFRSRDNLILKMLTKTADSMINYGLHDHLLGGFFRYTVDRSWRIPHFEKMLYDNALIARFLIELFRATRDPRYLIVSKKTVDFMISYMLNDHGLFASAIDADSDGVEGGFYLFSESELYDAIGKEFGEIAKIIYGYSPEYLIDGKMHLIRSMDVYGLAKILKIDIDEASRIYSEIEVKLTKYRFENKKHPFIDLKALIDWNMLAVISLAELYRCTRDHRYIDIGSNIVKKVIDNLFDGSKISHIVYPDGEISKYGYLEDIASFIEASIHMYTATFEERFIKYAEDLGELLLNQWLKNPNNIKEIHTPVSRIYGSYSYMDSPIPSGISMAVNSLAFLYLYSGEPKYRDQAKHIVKNLASYIDQYPTQFCYLLLALDTLQNPSYQISVTYSIELPEDLKKFIDEINISYLPGVVATWNGNEIRSRVLKNFFKGKKVSSQPTYYICYGTSCALPVNYSKKAIETITDLRSQSKI